MLKADYVELLAKKEHIALVLLMHLAVLFQPIKNTWWIGNWGNDLIHAVSSVLLKDWQHWAEFPELMGQCNEDMWKEEVFRGIKKVVVAHDAD